MNEILKKRIEEAGQAGSLHYNPETSAYSHGKQVGYLRGFNAGAEYALSHQWISVDEALPEEDPDCNKWLLLIVRMKTEDGGTRDLLEIGLYRGNGRFSRESLRAKVVAWMPVPGVEE